MTAATARSVVLRQKMQHIRGHSFGGRAVRFRRRQPSDCAMASVPDFASVAALPDWILASEEEQVRIGLSAAILKERQAIERELSGGRLACIAALVGTDLFERLCDSTLPDSVDGSGSSRLPRPEDFIASGTTLRRAAMPAAFRNTDVSESDAAEARLLCTIASRLVKMADADQ